MSKAIHGIPPHYLSDRIDMHLISIVTTPRKRVQWTIIFQLFTKRYTEIVFLYSGGKFFNDLPDFVTTLRILKLLNEITESI